MHDRRFTRISVTDFAACLQMHVDWMLNVNIR